MEIFHQICRPDLVLHPQVRLLLNLVLYHLVIKHVVPLLLHYQHSNLLLQLAHHLALNPGCKHLPIHLQGYHHHPCPALVSLYSLLTVPQYQQTILLELMKSTLALELMIYLNFKILAINLSSATGILPLLYQCM